MLVVVSKLLGMSEVCRIFPEVVLVMQTTCMVILEVPKVIWHNKVVFSMHKVALATCKTCSSSSTLVSINLVVFLVDNNLFSSLFSSRFLDSRMVVCQVVNAMCSKQLVKVWVVLIILLWYLVK